MGEGGLQERKAGKLTVPVAYVETLRNKNTHDSTQSCGNHYPSRSRLTANAAALTHTTRHARLSLGAVVIEGVVSHRLFQGDCKGFVDTSGGDGVGLTVLLLPERP